MCNVGRCAWCSRCSRCAIAAFNAHNFMKFHLFMHWKMITESIQTESLFITLTVTGTRGYVAFAISIKQNAQHSHTVTIDFHSNSQIANGKTVGEFQFVQCYTGQDVNTDKNSKFILSIGFFPFFTLLTQ